MNQQEYRAKIGIPVTFDAMTALWKLRASMCFVIFCQIIVIGSILLDTGLFGFPWWLFFCITAAAHASFFYTSLTILNELRMSWRLIIGGIFFMPISWFWFYPRLAKPLLFLSEKSNNDASIAEKSDTLTMIDYFFDSAPNRLMASIGIVLILGGIGYVRTQSVPSMYKSADYVSYEADDFSAEFPSAPIKTSVEGKVTTYTSNNAMQGSYVVSVFTLKNELKDATPDETFYTDFLQQVAAKEGASIENMKDFTLSGHLVKRGMYRSKNGSLVDMTLLKQGAKLYLLVAVPEYTKRADAFFDSFQLTQVLH